MATINENGISTKFCDLCTSYPKVLKTILPLFYNTDKKHHFNDEQIKARNKLKEYLKNKEIEYIAFTGNTKTEFGMPDITMRFTNGDYYFIEVKTRHGTDFQDNQTKLSSTSKYGYIGLINTLGQDPATSYGFIVDDGHNNCPLDNLVLKDKDKNNVYIPIITWSAVRDKLQAINKEFIDKKTPIEWFLKDLNDNVDGLENIDSQDNIKESYTNNEFVNKFKELELRKFIINDVGKNKLNFTIDFNKDDYSSSQFGWYGDITKDKEGTKTVKISLENNIWIGIEHLSDDANTYLVPNKFSSDSSSFYIVCYCGIISRDNIANDKCKNKKVMRNENNEVIYCESNEYWYYFPLDDLVSKYLNPKTDISKFVEDIQKRLEYILKHFIPNDTRRLNYIA